MQRREFIEKSAISASGILLSSPVLSKINMTGTNENKYGIKEINKNLAIAMWDFSWMLRHYKSGGFEDWDKALSELSERGYNAIRIDCFPHLIAPDPNGTISEIYYHPKNDWAPALWGNQYSIYSNPRKSIIEFLSKCNEYNIHVGLATWFLGDGSNKNKEVKGLEGFVRVWNDTLSFIDNNGLLNKILYVDLLNEYPLWHGYEWLEQELASMSDKYEFLKANPDAHIQNIDFLKSENKKYNELQEKFYKDFMTRAIKLLKEKWPKLNFFASLTHSQNVPWEDMDFSQFDALDSHIWFVHNPDFGDSTGYYNKIHSCTNDLGFEATYKALKLYWNNHKTDLISWMESEIRKRSEISRKNGMVCGNTEGWGAISWYEHPALDWEFIKESAEICVDLSLKYGFKFICTSNFTHPHFNALWDDKSWHKNLTDRIKNP